MPGLEWVGWIATAVFVASYFFSHPRATRAVQIAGATVWIAYGLVIHARPVVAANALVLTAAAVTLLRRPSSPSAPDVGAGGPARS